MPRTGDSRRGILWANLNVTGRGEPEIPILSFPFGQEHTSVPLSIQAEIAKAFLGWDRSSFALFRYSAYRLGCRNRPI